MNLGASLHRLIKKADFLNQSIFRVISGASEKIRTHDPNDCELD